MLAADQTSAWDRLRSYLPSDHDLFKLAAAILVLVLCWFLARVARRLVIREMRRVKADPQVVLLVSRLSFLAAVVIGIVAAFTILFGSPALVFGGFGFLALAFSLAFQDILKNFIAGIFLLLERPFRLGDEITVDTHTGAVEDIEMRTTTLRTSNGEQVLIPNSLLYTGTITNRSRYPTRLFTLTAKIPSGASVDGVAERVREQLQKSPDVAKDPAPQVGVQPNIDGGLTLEVRYWLDYRKHDPLTVQAAIGQQLYRAIQPPIGNGGAAAATTVTS
ncbi:MAG: mechanosensitive ion channel [Candidatus Dormibacteraeota bacterium]|nr:mechanosensitive ion channel [Candidatus Dormibacteraeota bacterium]